MSKVPRHGTVARYRLELKDKTVCDACRSANSRAQRMRRQRARQAGATPLLSIVPDIQPAPTSAPTSEDTPAEPAKPAPHHVPAYAATEQAVHNDLNDVDVETPFYHSLRAAALVLAREIDDVNSKASKAPLVKQLVDVIRELKGKDAAGGNSLQDLLQDLSAPLVPVGGS